MCRRWTASPAVRGDHLRGLQKSARTRWMGGAEYHFGARMGTPPPAPGPPEHVAHPFPSDPDVSSTALRPREVRHYCTDRRRARGHLPHLGLEPLDRWPLGPEDAGGIRRAGRGEDPTPTGAGAGASHFPERATRPTAGRGAATASRKRLPCAAAEIGCRSPAVPSPLASITRARGNLPRPAVKKKEICYGDANPDRNREIQDVGAVLSHRQPLLLISPACRNGGSLGSVVGGAI